ncbi:unnamed protein product [Microthlaspi erraticum]|uniref:DUF4218 domain-containing protein n=1 Tax=Microthlaspi erraticum TaxID=1685480 RepID=A0A6D2J721_9BRAS|nr:unnamed protein product [Microthlaspi erraticum]
MHIEKNVFDNLVNTLLDEKSKSKDKLNARKDLRELGIRSDLWPDDNGKYKAACFTLTVVGKDIFMNVLKSVKYPDGYASNISMCVDLNNGKLLGLKSHDCHVLVRDLVPIAIQNLLQQEVTSVVVELCHFFGDISARVLDISDLDKLQERIVLTLCQMEMLFPPSFFTVMVHLVVHLTEEAKQGGPVPFRWMYPIERILGHFKSYVRNCAKPEGSMCAQYLADECVTFCSMYLDDIETRFSRGRWVDDRPTAHNSGRPNSELHTIFQNVGRFVGAALGPAETAMKYAAYNVNGFKFRNTERDDNLKTQNSGVYVAAETMSYASSRDPNHRSGDVPYYGRLVEVIELNY